jgi:hypothetical protein
MTPCRFVISYRCFGGNACLQLQGSLNGYAGSTFLQTTLKMELTNSSELCVTNYQPTQRLIPEEFTLPVQLCENRILRHVAKS